MTGKKSTVVWPAMFFEPPEKITTQKKKVQLSAETEKSWTLELELEEQD